MLSGTRAFERELKTVLRYATIWQAVVLFDEADVFLEARTDNSADRNTLVASKPASSPPSPLGGLVTHPFSFYSFYHIVTSQTD